MELMRKRKKKITRHLGHRLRFWTTVAGVAGQA